MIKGFENSNNGVQTATKVAEQPSYTVELTKESMAPAVIESTRQTYDLTPAREQYKQEILASGIVDELTSQIDITSTTSIIEFGRKPADEMAKAADQVLSKYDMSTVNQTSKLVDNLLAVMKQVDITELEDAKTLLANRAKKTFLDKFRESAQQKLERLVGKYQALGGDMEKICEELAVYEQQIKQSNADIAKMYENAKVNYKTLTAYILAGEEAVKEIQVYRDNKQNEFEKTGNPDLQFEIQNINQALSLMEQRVADLRGAEAVALQSIPTFKIQEVTNANLARKINSAFIITVPAFKTALVNSVISKQQAIQAQGLEALDEATSMLVRRNADNAVKQLETSQRLANSSAIKADDIEYAWNKIMTGIQQYKDMEASYSEIRKDEARRIEQANENYLQSLRTGSSI